MSTILLNYHETVDLIIVGNQKPPQLSARQSTFLPGIIREANLKSLFLPQFTNYYKRIQITARLIFNHNI